MPFIFTTEILPKFIFPYDDSPQLLALATHENAIRIRIRMKNHDAPESKFAVRIYKQAEASTTMQNFVNTFTSKRRRQY